MSKWVIDASHSSVEFAVKHMMFATARGRFSEVEGFIEGDPADLTSARIEAVISAASIDTRESQRDDHLRSADFFDVENYPHLKFVSTEITKTGDDRYKVVGDLTIRDVTLPIELDTRFTGSGKDPWGNQRIGLSAEGKVKRKDYGLTWNTLLESGGVLVGDDVKITLDVEAVQQAE